MLDAMDVRVSLNDFRMACGAVDEAYRAGRGALERTAVTFGVRRAFVMAAVDRIETALGGAAFFEARVRRSGVLTAAGDAFRQKAPRLIRAWQAMLPQGSNVFEADIEVRDAPGRKVDLGASPSATLGKLVAAVGRQSRRIDEVVALVESSRMTEPRDGPASAGTKAADAMKAVLAILKEAGANGIDSRGLGVALQSTGIKSGSAETAKAILRAAGLVRFEGRHWYID